MDDPRQSRETGAAYSVPIADLSQPVILQHDGQPVAVVISIEEYERYRDSLKGHQGILASQARRAADRAVFRDLVGCALSSGEPIWVSVPQAHWQVPYRSFDGTLMMVVKVDARNGEVFLTDEERTTLLDQVEHYVTAYHAAA